MGFLSITWVHIFFFLIFIGFRMISVDQNMDHHMNTIRNNDGDHYDHKDEDDSMKGEESMSMEENGNIRNVCGVRIYVPASATTSANEFSIGDKFNLSLKQENNKS